MEETEEQKVPQSIKDLDWMIETSRNHNTIEIKSLLPEDYGKPGGTELKVGDEQHRDISIYTYSWSNKIEIRTSTAIVQTIYGPKHYSCTYRTDDEQYYTFEEFKNSKWWDIVLNHFSDGSPSYSELESIKVNGQVLDDDFLEFNGNIKVYGRDWLGNHITQPYTEQCAIYMNTDGELTLCVQEHYTRRWDRIECDIRKAIKAVQLMDKLESAGFELDDDCFRYSFEKKEDE